MKDSLQEDQPNLFTRIRLSYWIRWIFISTVTGILSGTASAWFLYALTLVSTIREQHLWLIYLLPFSGAGIVLCYKHFGKNAAGGNNLIISEIQHPKDKIPLVMAPLIFFGTILTHLFGGSAGREGSAVQMGATFAEQLTSWLKLDKRDRQLALIAGISAGFASVFGTPFAGTVFAIEVIFIGSLLSYAILPSIIAAFTGHYICLLWQAKHVHYHIDIIPEIDLKNIVYCIIAGLCFGLTGRLSSKILHYCQLFFNRQINKDFIRPIIGGSIIVIFYILWGNTDYLGLGLPKITESFSTPQPYYAFLLKIVLTAITLGAGFKGGEVTPLFFIGACLGSFLSLLLGLPTSLLAGIGFVAVFGAASNTPVACIIMGIELFGWAAAPYLIISCIIAFLVSGNTGIYTSQTFMNTNHWYIRILLKLKGK